MEFRQNTTPARTRVRLLAAFALAVLLLIAAHPRAAHAENPCDADNPPDYCFETYDDSTTATLTVNMPGGAHVVSSGGLLDCTASCSRSRTYTRTCSPVSGCPDFVYSDYTLSASGGPAGYAPAWTNCGWISGTICGLTLDASRTVTLGWADVTPPTIAFSPPAKVGAATTIGASGSDNSGSWSFDWWVDGTALTQHGPSMVLGPRPEGEHVIQVRTKDPSNLASATITKTVVLDRSVNVTVPAPPAYTNAATLPVGFTTDGDVVPDSRRCSVNGAAPVACTPEFSPIGALSPDGAYAYTVTVTDDVGNTATSPARSFVLDRTPPVVAFTDGPTEGQLVTTRAATLTFAATDANPDPATSRCSVDGHPAVACTTPTTLALTSLADGQHVVVVSARDKAGNVGTKTRRFSVRATETGGGEPGPTGGQPGPTGSQPGPTGDQPGPATGGGPSVLGAIATVVAWNYDASRAYTVLPMFRLSGLPKGATAVITCKGRGCPKRAIRLHGPGTKPIKPLVRRHLAKGTVIVVRITKPGYVGKVVRIVTRLHKRPVSKTLCLQPGATRPGSCG
jgi:hypothetical protein